VASLPRKSQQSAQPESGPKRAALYLRVSGRKQERGSSLKTQEQECRAYCAEQSYVVDEAHVYRETHKASELWRRPELTRLRDAVRAAPFDVAVFHCQDRFSRSQAHTYILVEEFERAGVRFEFALERLEDTAIGRFMHSARAFAAEVEVLYQNLRYQLAGGPRGQRIEEDLRQLARSAVEFVRNVETSRDLRDVRQAFAALDREWNQVVTDFNSATPPAPTYFRLRAQAAETIHDNLHQLLGVERERTGRVTPLPERRPPLP
jgi:hypothetical protein